MAALGGEVVSCWASWDQIPCLRGHLPQRYISHASCPQNTAFFLPVRMGFTSVSSPSTFHVL